MRRSLVLLVAVASLASACRTSAPTKAAPAVTPAPAAVKTQPARTLAAGKAATVTLAGQVLLDAAYATAHGQGQRVVVGGQAVLAMDGGSLISQDGGTIVNGSGQIVAQGGGNVVVPAGVISNDGSSLISQDGGTLIDDGAALIGQDGGTPISQDGGTIVAQGGGNILSHNGGSYRLAGADAPGSLPAVGMWVGVVDMHTGKAVPLGEDGAGNPVLAVYSDAAGKYAVHLPASLAGNVRVVARAPGATDPRLNLHVIAPAGAAATQPVDDIHVAATRYMREVIAEKLALLLAYSADRVPDLLGNGVLADKAAVAVTVAALAEVGQALKDAKAQDLPPARQHQLELLAADRLLADFDLGGIQVQAGLQDDADQGQPAVAVFSGIIQALNQAVMAKAAGQSEDQLAASFAGKPYVLAANQACGDVSVRGPADLDDLLIYHEFMANDVHLVRNVGAVCDDLGLPAGSGNRAVAAGLSLYRALAARMLEAVKGPDGAQVTVGALMAATVRDAAAAFRAAPPPPSGPGACRPAIPAPASAPTVELLAGSAKGLPGTTPDGPGDLAGFSGPRGIAIAPGTGAAYVTDGNTNTLKRLARGADGRVQVANVVGPSDDKLAADGAAEAARFVMPGPIACDADGVLYVADLGRPAIRRVRFDAAGRATVDTLAGTGEPGFADGPGKQARFALVSGLAVDAHHHLYVADTNNERIRRIDLADPAFPVTTVMGNGTADSLDAPRSRDALVKQPYALAFDPAGTLYFGEVGAARVGAIAAPADGTTPTRLVAGGAQTGAPDGYWSNASFRGAVAMAFDARGRLLVADLGNRTLRAITPDSAVTTVAGGGPVLVFDANGNTARPADLDDGTPNRFFMISGLAVAPDGSAWVVDTNNNNVRRVVFP